MEWLIRPLAQMTQGFALGVWSTCGGRKSAGVSNRHRHHEVEQVAINLITACSLPARQEGDFGGGFVRRNRSRPIAPPWRPRQRL